MLLQRIIILNNSTRNSSRQTDTSETKSAMSSTSVTQQNQTSDEAALPRLQAECPVSKFSLVFAVPPLILSQKVDERQCLKNEIYSTRLLGLGSARSTGTECTQSTYARTSSLEGKSSVQVEAHLGVQSIPCIHQIIFRPNIRFT